MRVNTKKIIKEKVQENMTQQDREAAQYWAKQPDSHVYVQETAKVWLLRYEEALQNAEYENKTLNRIIEMFEARHGNILWYLC